MSLQSRLNAFIAAVGADVKSLKAADAGLKFYVPEERRYAGPNSDLTSFTGGVAADGTFNETYVISGNVLPANWPVDVFGVENATSASNTWIVKTSVATIGTVATYRIMTDGDQIILYTMGAPYTVEIFVDGRPYATMPASFLTTASNYGYQKLVFPSAKPRLVEVRTITGLVGVYVKKPYRAWKPAPDLNPSVAVVGDSFVQPTVMSDTVAGSAGGDTYLPGMYQRMAALLGISSMVSDGLNGSGFLVAGGNGVAYPGTARVNWLTAINPDVIVVHGGGLNDLNQGQTVAAIITAAVNYFTNLHNLMPNARLVFVEGIATPSLAFNANYISIRQGVQTQLAAAGVPAYFIDVATTRPPINGTGFVTAANSSGNSDIYIGSDGVHPTVKGHQYLRGFLAPKIARVLADDSRELVGQLI